MGAASLNDAQLLDAVKAALDCTSAVLLDFRAESISYRVYRQGRSLTRFSGTAECAGVNSDWSIVRKTGINDREAHAYRASWLNVPAFRAASTSIARRGYAAAAGLRWSIIAKDPRNALAQFVQERTDEAL